MHAILRSVSSQNDQTCFLQISPRGHVKEFVRKRMDDGSIFVLHNHSLISTPSRMLGSYSTSSFYFRDVSDETTEKRTEQTQKQFFVGVAPSNCFGVWPVYFFLASLTDAFFVPRTFFIRFLRSLRCFLAVFFGSARPCRVRR